MLFRKKPFKESIEFPCGFLQLYFRHFYYLVVILVHIQPLLRMPVNPKV